MRVHEFLMKLTEDFTEKLWLKYPDDVDAVHRELDKFLAQFEA